MAMTSLGHRMYSMLEEKKRMDIAFLVGPENFQVPAHICVLAANSDVFDTRFSEPWKKDLGDKNDHSYPVATFTLPSNTPEAVNAFVKGMYLDYVNPKLDLNVLTELLVLCHTYMVKNLFKVCERLIISRIIGENCVSLMEMRMPSISDISKPVWEALFNCLKTNLTYCTFGSSKGTSIIPIPSITAPSINWSEETWDLVLDLEGPQIASIGEHNLFAQLLLWRDKDDTRQEKIKMLIRKVRFLLMTLSEFSTIVVPSKVLSAEEVVDIICYFTKKTDIPAFNSQPRHVQQAAKRKAKSSSEDSSSSDSSEDERPTRTPGRLLLVPNVVGRVRLPF